MVGSTIQFSQDLNRTGGRNCSNVTGIGAYNLRSLYLYNMIDSTKPKYGYQSAKINNQYDMTLVSVDDHQFVGTFSLMPLALAPSMDFLQIQNITFSADPVV